MIYKMYQMKRETRRDLTQSHDKSPYIHRKKKTKNNVTTHKRHQKLRLHRSVGVTITTQLVWLNLLTGSQPSHSPQQFCNLEQEHTGIILQLAEILKWNVSKEIEIKRYLNWNNFVTRKEENPIALMFNLNILEHAIVCI